MTVIMRSRAICTIKRLCLQSLHVGGEYVHAVHRLLSGLHVYCPKAEFRIEPGLQLGLESLRSNHCLMLSTRSVLIQESIVRLHAWPALDLMFQEDDRACACGAAMSVFMLGQRLISCFKKMIERVPVALPQVCLFKTKFSIFLVGQGLISCFKKMIKRVPVVFPVACPIAVMLP